jgi:CheY-like chemotaxis protein
VKLCILVVEDNQLNRELLRDWLEVEGYEVWCAGDLKASYEVFSKRLPDAVLLDINLGKDDGVVRQFVVPDMKKISFCLAQALRFGTTG